jgi:hypothetical protein
MSEGSLLTEETLVDIWQVLAQAPIGQLRRSVAHLQRQPKEALTVGLSPTEEVKVGSTLALELLCMAIQARQDIIASLRQAAAHEPDSPPDGIVGIAQWVGALTPEWYAVFAYSSPVPTPAPHPEAARWPWFSQLDVEDQRLVLLLVATAMETDE